MTLQLRNPHSVLATLQCRPESVIEVTLADRAPTGAWRDVGNLALKHRIPVVQSGPKPDRGRGRANKSGRVGTAEATIRERPDVPLNELFAADGGSQYGLWLALDHVQDPHNVGAIFRSAAFFGVRGIVITRDQSAPVNATVYDVAAGGVEYVPFSMQTNLQRALKSARDSGLWVLGTSEHCDHDLAEVSADRNWLVVLGNEEKGMRRLTQEMCDVVCGIRPRGGVGSLNVSVAAGVIMSALTG